MVEGQINREPEKEKDKKKKRRDSKYDKGGNQEEIDYLTQVFHQLRDEYIAKVYEIEG